MFLLHCLYALLVFRFTSFLLGFNLTGFPLYQFSFFTSGFPLLLVFLVLPVLLVLLAALEVATNCVHGCSYFTVFTLY